MHGFGDGFHDMDLFTPDGGDLGHIVHHGGDTTLTDALGDPQTVFETTNGIDQILNAHGQEIGVIDPNHEISMHDGSLWHVEKDAFGRDHLVNELHPTDDTVITSAPFGGESITSADGIPLAFAKERFNV